MPVDKLLLQLSFSNSKSDLVATNSFKAVVLMAGSHGLVDRALGLGDLGYGFKS